MRYRIMIVLLVMLSLPMFAFAASTTYTYDDLNRLHEVIMDNGQKITYEYDEIGNMISKTGLHCAAGTTYDPATNRCGAVPTCVSGTYSAATDNCVSGGTYAATVVNTWNVAVYAGIVFDFYIYPVAPIIGYANATAFTNSLPLWGFPGSGWSSANVRVKTGSYGYLADCTSLDGFLSSKVAGYASATPTAIATMSTSRRAFSTWSVDYLWTRRTITGSSCDVGTVFISPTVANEYSCPSGGTLSDATCNSTTYTTATCPAGTSLDIVADRCVGDPI